MSGVVFKYLLYCFWNCTFEEMLFYKNRILRLSQQQFRNRVKAKTSFLYMQLKLQFSKKFIYIIFAISGLKETRHYAINMYNTLSLSVEYMYWFPHDNASRKAFGSFFQFLHVLYS